MLKLAEVLAAMRNLPGANELVEEWGLSADWPLNAAEVISDFCRYLGLSLPIRWNGFDFAQLSARLV